MTQTVQRPDTPTQQQHQRPSLPDKPKLADGVRLAGQMQESAFVDPPWLLEREGAGYIQVTELLYQIAEQCDGQHSLDEIAQVVSDKSGRSVTAENVHMLVAKQLVPRGLIEIPGVEIPKPAAGARSPLALNMRVRMIGPDTIGPLVNVLRILYWPPVLIAVLIVTALAEAWVYFVHGVGSSFHDALYQPGLMVLILGSIVIAAGFHELGHAAALHYGGGKIKGMGAGIYVVYPAFFTDVSDNYRLSRWARVRTDLGGFYFNLLFALAVLGIYLLTGWEVLLMVVVLINLEIIHQLLPFLRLDGYWTLADITGVPDFFSQMGAFVRTVLPFKAGEGRKLPDLKWWAKFVFGLYMLITIPVLVVLLVVMIKSIPRVLATAWDSGGKLGQGFMSSMAQGDILGMLGGVLQLLLLALPILGLCYTLYSLGKRGITGIWNWSKPTPMRRVIGSLGVLSAAALVGFMWAPQLPLGFGGGQPGPMYGQVRFDPIVPNERGTIQDGVAGVVATREPIVRPGETATPAGTPQPQGTPTPGSLVAPDRQPEPTGVATAATAVTKPTSGPPGTAVAPTVVATPVATTAAQGASAPATATAAALRGTPAAKPTLPPAR
jgi:putative peptide zinc metalloprotease protein